MKTSIGIACYFSANRDRVPDAYVSDYLYFVKTHMQVFEKMGKDLHKIYLVCTYDEPTINMEYINSYLYELMESNPKVVILNRPNLGGSYAGYQNILEFDNNDSDYMIFTEDDYALVENSIFNMLEYYKETPEMIYLCTLWNNERYLKDGIDIAGHAQMSGGMLNVKLYNKLKKENNLDFTIFTFPGKTAIYNNQVCFLEDYRKNGILIRDMKESYACVYLNDKDSIINFGNKTAEDIFIPISDWYPNHCPNLRYNW